MVQDTEDTKCKTKEAAAVEFTRYDLGDTTVEQIAKKAGINKERTYDYFGDKRTLFATVLRDGLATVAQAVSVISFTAEDTGDYAGRVYDHHHERPEFIRLFRWEALALDSEVPDEDLCRTFYRDKTAAVPEGRKAGAATKDINPV